MARKGSSSVGKCLAYHAFDWNDVIAIPLEFTAPSNTQWAPSSTLEGKKKK
jgi:hypothetical protein